MPTDGGAYIIAQNGSDIFGGGERFIVKLLLRLEARGHRSLLLCRDAHVASEARRRGVEARVFRVGGHAALYDAVRLGAFLRRASPDALLLSSFNKIFLGGMAGRLGGVPRVVARFGLSTDRPARRFVYRVALRRWVDRVVVNSTEFRDAVRADVPDVEARRVITIFNGVEPPRRERPAGALRRELGIDPAAPVIGALARLSSQKRLDRLLHLTAALPGAVTCIVAGHGPEEAGLRQLARDLGIAERVRFLGLRDDVGDVLDALDVYVVTSEREGLSNSMLEALACGVPVVSTPVSGASTALEPLADGRLPGRIAGPDPGALAVAVAELLGDPGLRERMGEAARARVRERFDWNDKLDRWEQLLCGDPMADVGEH